MGEITVRGYAEKEINYDLVALTITFRARENSGKSDSGSNETM